jgi:hypothetical protein
MSPDGKVLGRVRKMMEPDEFLTILTPAIQKLHSNEANIRAQH